MKRFPSATKTAQELDIDVVAVRRVFAVLERADDDVPLPLPAVMAQAEVDRESALNVLLYLFLLHYIPARYQPAHEPCGGSIGPTFDVVAPAQAVIESGAYEKTCPTCGAAVELSATTIALLFRTPPAPDSGMRFANVCRFCHGHQADAAAVACEHCIEANARRDDAEDTTSSS